MTSEPYMRVDKPVLGILLMLGFCIGAPVGDAVVKVLGDALPLAMVVAVRFAIQGLLLVPLTAALGVSLAVPKGLWPMVILRTALHICGLGVMFLALRFLPLADAIAIAYVMPFIVLLAGALWLGEEVGARRLAACCVGFVGTLLILQPSFADVGAVALLPVVVAVIFAAFMLVTRQISRDIAPLELQAVNGIVGVLLMVPLLVIGVTFEVPELGLALPSARESWLLLFIGLLGTVAHLFLTWALRMAPASTLAPIQYLEIPMAVLVGLAFFGQFPDGRAIAGIGIVMGAGLYIIWRENAQARAAPT